MNKSFVMSSVRVASYVGGIALLLGTAANAYANTGSISIQSVSPGNSIPVGTKVTFTIVPTGFNANPKYSLSDSYHSGSLGSYDLNSLGAFSWTPVQNDVGTHAVAILVTDSSSNAATADITLTVTPSGTAVSNTGNNTTSASTASLGVQSLSPVSGAVTGAPITFQVVPTGFSGTVTYSVVDSSETSSLSSSALNSNGAFYWVPAAGDAGTHILTINASDSSGHQAQATTALIIGAGATQTTTTGTTATQTTSTPTFTADLALGSNDPQVALLQQVLTTLGDLTVTGNGHFGPATQAAVMKFQADHNIAQLGNVGPATRAALNALQSTTTSGTTTAPSSSIVSQLQAEIQTILAQIQQMETQLASL